jgi:NADH-quinone oxidoreductase subunit E
MSLEFSDSAKKEIDKLMGRYPTRQAALLPALYLAQREFGFISDEVVAYLSKTMELPKSRIFGVATFYTMFNKKPVGKYFIQVCGNISCAMLGADSLFDYLSQKLGIKEGETSKDGRFTLCKVECLGACGEAPMMQINDNYYGSLTKDKVNQILEGLK